MLSHDDFNDQQSALFDHMNLTNPQALTLLVINMSQRVISYKDSTTIKHCAFCTHCLGITVMSQDTSNRIWILHDILAIFLNLLPGYRIPSYVRYAIHANSYSLYEEQLLQIFLYISPFHPGKVLARI